MNIPIYMVFYHTETTHHSFDRSPLRFIRIEREEAVPVATMQGFAGGSHRRWRSSDRHRGSNRFTVAALREDVFPATVALGPSSRRVSTHSRCQVRVTLAGRGGSVGMKRRRHRVPLLGRRM